MDAQLLTEFDETVKDIAAARTALREEGYWKEGQRGGGKAHPALTALRDAQANLVRIARILTARNQEVPVDEDELARLLD